MEAEGAHMTAVREAEAACAAHTFDLQQAHGETMQALESEAITEEGWAHQSFLWVCRAALKACPAEALGVLMYPIQLLTENMSLITLLMAAPQQTISLRVPSPHLPAPRGPLWQHTPLEVNGNTACLNMRWDWTNPKMNPHHAPKSHPNEGERRKIPWWDA